MSELPTSANNLTEKGDWFSSYVHVYGCVEKDVNSQLTKILDVGIYNEMVGENTMTVKFRTTPTVDQRFYFENVDWGKMEEGEFYHDMLTNKIYVYTGNHDKQYTNELLLDGAIIPLLDTLLDVSHSSNILIKNLTFLDTTFFSDGYWDGPGQQPADSAVTVNYSNNVTIMENQFLHSLGGGGIGIGNGTVDSRVCGNLFDHVGETGVIMYGYVVSLAVVRAKPGRSDERRRAIPFEHPAGGNH